MTDRPDSFPKMVLVVDDEPAILDILKRQLEAENYAVITETSGRGAVEVARNTSLAAVLLDLQLGDVSGFDVLQQIKSSKPRLPVIIVTGSHQEAEARRAFELGAWDYITKPIDFKHLSNVLLQSSS